MNEFRYVVTWSSFGSICNKIYKRRKPAFTFVNKLLCCFSSCDSLVITVEKQEQKDDKWIMIDRWLYD